MPAMNSENFHCTIYDAVNRASLLRASGSLVCVCMNTCLCTTHVDVTEMYITTGAK